MNLTSDDVYLAMIRVVDHEIHFSPPSGQLFSASFSVGEMSPDHSVFQDLADRLNQQMEKKQSPGGTS